jgi:uncharacterized protein YecE (DUF72 family)
MGVTMAKILVGTCGYGYNEWVGPVYPEGTKPVARLSLYSGLFRTVELDHTYYGMPKPANLEKMLVTGGPDLTFSIKAYRTLTHEVNPSSWEGIDPFIGRFLPLAWGFESRLSTGGF